MFGDDAEKFLNRAKKRLAEKKPVISDESDDISYVGIDDEEPNIILMGDEDKGISLDDGGIDPSLDEDGLDVIYPDDTPYTPSNDALEGDDDLTKALEELDAEDDEDISAEDFGFENGDIPEL